MSELKAEQWLDYAGEPRPCYPKSEADKVIAEKDAEIARLKAMAEEREKEIEFMHSNCKWYAGDGCARLHGELMAAIGDVGELKAEIESLKASHYADSVDAGMRERRLNRALWMHRAITAKFNKESCKAMREYNPFIGIEEYKWQEVERKCLKKAEEYK